MPSFVLSDADLPSSPETARKSKQRKSKIADPLDLEAPISQNPTKKKTKQRMKIESDDNEDAGIGDEKKRSGRKKKRKLSDEERSDTSSDVGEILVSPADRKAASAANGHLEKKQKLAEDDGEVTASGDDDDADADPNAVSNYRISLPLREKLKSRGITSLFPIQAMTFDLVLDGCDLVGRARTGQGKTLAFVLPILESLTNGRHKASRNSGRGWPPSVLVLLPTRELANQVHADFEIYGRAVGLSACCLYGGSSFNVQANALRKGVDIVVGTPGRIKDHLERGTLDLKLLKFRVLDEADEMLNMGFVDDVELILGKVQDVKKVQTLLFSATMPEWVKKVILAGLRSGRFSVLVATNVAARGLDINDVQLIIQGELGGPGKTLAFVLPILESLTNGRHKASRNTDHGWPPSVLVHADFKIYGCAVGLSTCCLYGGSSFNAQANALRKGVNIVIGAPGRIKDHLERGTLDLKLLKYRVLDEADKMLNMSFVDDIELMLGIKRRASTEKTNARLLPLNPRQGLLALIVHCFTGIPKESMRENSFRADLCGQFID